MKLNRSLAAMLAVLTVAAASGCSPASGSSQSQSSQSSDTSSVSDSEQFEQMLTEEFSDLVSNSLVDCTFMLENPAGYGITDVKKQMGSIDFDQLDNATKLWQEDIDKLHSFNYRKLTEEQQLIYDLLEYQSKLIEPVLTMSYYDEINSPLLGVQSNLPTTLGEFRFDTVQDVQDYIEMMGTAGAYFDDMAEYQRRRSVRGLFMSDRMATSVVDFCRRFAAEGEDCLLVEGFPERLEQFADLGKAERDQLIDSNRKAVLEQLLPAYERFADELEKLKGTGREDVGMAALPDGKAYYEYMVAYGSGSSWDMQTIITTIDSTMQKYHREMFETIIGDPSIYDRMINYSGSKQSPDEIVQDLIKQCKGRFPELDTLSYDIKYVHPSQEDNSSPAFYYIPAIDSSGSNTIYINRKYVDNYPTLYTLLGHEGYPGHMYQNNYSVQQQPHPIRRLLDSAGYSEGWAKYVENLCYEMAGINDPDVARLLQISDDLDLLISTRADIGVNYEGWGLEQLADMLAKYNVEDEDITKDIYQAVIDEPANYVKYAVGYLEFVALRDRAQGVLGDSFDELEFHRTLLDDGAVPFSFVSSAVDCYISDRLITSSNKAA